MYAYCTNNPVKYVDYTGRKEEDTILLLLLIYFFAKNSEAKDKSEEAVSNPNIHAMSKEQAENIKYVSELSDTKTQIEYIKYLKQNDADNEYANWTEAEMLREIKYHYTLFQVVLFFDPNAIEKIESLEYSEESFQNRVSKVNFESEQTTTTYIRRFIGNGLVSWEVKE